MTALLLIAAVLGFVGHPLAYWADKRRERREALAALLDPIPDPTTDQHRAFPNEAWHAEG